MKKISVYTNHYWPEVFKINEIVDYLTLHYKVNVITQIPNYPKGHFYSGYGYFKKNSSSSSNLKIERLPVIPRGKSKFTLSLNYVSYAITSLVYSIKKRRHSTDLVFIYITSPIFISWSAIKHANKQNVPKIMYLLDLWPDNLISMIGIKNKKVIYLLERLCIKIYKQMDIIFVSSLDFKHVLISYGINESIIRYLPQHVKHVSPKIKKIDHEKKNILFAGNVGEAQGLDLLVHLSVELQKLNYNKLHFIILGDGRYKSSLIEKVKDRQVIDYFTFYDAVAPDGVTKFYEECDMGLVILKDDPVLNKHLPAKVQDYMAHSMPILAFCNGETERIIKDAKCGIIINHKSYENMAVELIKELDSPSYNSSILSHNAYNYANDHFEYESNMNTLTQEIEEILKF